MLTRTDTLTKYFQCMMGHFAMSTIVIFDQTPYLEASTVGGVPVTEESRIGFTVCLVLTKVAIILEFFSIALGLPSIPRSVFATTSHTVATCLFLLFIYDSHPPFHFWILFVVFSLPSCILAIISLFRKASGR
ncbi:hypothetical protein GCK72_003587 [Caenorhabditis remanei]|uniref:Transmembrane protein 107 n=1 Tax=Caenorhabditis remanei TaxID=31234 RepID=A0A6A5HVA1_CAERE|nr:hypothetical protein GCK72_003587 [Caenorhabditis remanei]KAF1771759.1 hypothetical protein GCK72_003587 [Caenorhabditis remanei]